MKKITLLLLALLLSLTIFTACGDNADSNVDSSSNDTSSSDVDSSSDEATDELTLTVVHKDGSEKVFTVVLPEEGISLAEYLVENKIAEGEDSEYGFFITTVDGEKADATNQEWWCITKAGEAVMEGSSSIILAKGDKYELTLTVGY